MTMLIATLPKRHINISFEHIDKTSYLAPTWLVLLSVVTYEMLFFLVSDINIKNNGCMFKSVCNYVLFVMFWIYLYIF